MKSDSSLHIVTVSTDIKYYMPYLIESVKKHNNELTILGLNMKWLGFNWRYKMMKEHLSKLPEDDIVCFCDGYDVLCVRDLNEMIDEFNRIKNETKCKIIYSIDSGLGQFKPYTSLYFTSKLTTNMINAGLYIGNVKDLLEMYNILFTYSSEDYLDDQMLLNKFYQMNPGVIYIDKKSELFYTLCEYNIYIKIKNFFLGKPDDLIRFVDIKDDKLYSINKTRPFFIHGCVNGYLNTIIKKLGYKIDHKDNNPTQNMNIKKIINNIKSEFILYKYNYLFYIIIIAIFYLLVNYIF